MLMANPYAQYQKQAVSTSTPGELVVLLFTGAVKNINLAICSIKEKQVCEANNRIIKAEKIFNALIESLDMRYPIAKDLSKLYAFFNDRLLQANIKKDASILEEILPLVVDLRNTWQEAEKINSIGERKLG